MSYISLYTKFIHIAYHNICQIELGYLMIINLIAYHSAKSTEPQLNFRHTILTQGIHSTYLTNHIACKTNNLEFCHVFHYCVFAKIFVVIQVLSLVTQWNRLAGIMQHHWSYIVWRRWHSLQLLQSFPECKNFTKLLYMSRTSDYSW